MPVQPTDAIVTSAAAGTGLPPAVVAAQINLESGGDPNAVSPAGAEGEFQFLPSTYTGLGFPAGTEFNPAVEVRAYEVYMSSLLTWAGGNVRKALAAYNAGQGNWQAGLGYADTVLGNARAGAGLTASPPGGTTVGGQVSQGGGPGGVISGIAGDIWGVLGLPLKIIKGVGDLPAAVLTLAAPFVRIAQALDWFFHPANWIRLFAGLAGGVLVLAGVWQMSHAGGA